MRRPSIRSLAGGAAGIAVGVIGGIVLTSVSAAGSTPALNGPAVIDAAHVPPALTLPGEHVRLRYAIVCTPRGDGEPCDGSGTVYIRAGRKGAYRPFPLRRGDDSSDGRYYVDVPPAISDSPAGFSYYADLRDDSSGAAMSLPAGGADAPQRSVPLRDAVHVSLGLHHFGAVRAPAERVAEAPWGPSTGSIGLAGTRELGLIGPSSFDVERDGTVDVLDSVNGHVLRVTDGRRETVALGDRLPLADFAVAPDGSFDVLDVRGALRRYGPDGRRKWTQKLAERTWVKLAQDDAGPVVLQEPSEQWMPTAQNGAPLSRAQQARGGSVAKHLSNGHDVVVAHVDSGELRIAEVRGGTALRSWRITSETPLGEVQLVESHGNRVVVVTRPYTDDRDEFEVLVLDAHGLAGSFAVGSESWTETAPLARFRLALGSLYRLRTAASGVYVDRFALEVPQ